MGSSFLGSSFGGVRVINPVICAIVATPDITRTNIIVLFITASLALFLLNVVAVTIVHISTIDELYKLTLIAILGLILPNVINGIMKGGEKSEDSISDRVEKTIDKIVE